MSPKLVTIRTEEAEVWRYKSEVATHSDRRRGNPDEQVRSWSSFGQEKWISIGESPKHEVKSSNNF